MPTKPPSPCRHPGCPTLVPHPGRCTTHDRGYKAKLRTSYTWEDYGSEWRKIRVRVLQSQPTCQAPGCNKQATDVDHIVPLRLGGTHERSNLQALCHSHHSTKTVTESNNRDKRGTLP